MLINKTELLKYLHGKMDRKLGEEQRGIAGVIGAIESGKFDILPEPTEQQLMGLISYHDGWKDAKEHAEIDKSRREDKHEWDIPT